MNQLLRLGYADAELRLVCDAYDLATRFFACRYQPSGETLIDHVVRTASIVATQRPSADLVAAALLHNVYHSGDFGLARRGTSAAKRDRLRTALGPGVEEYIYGFCASTTPIHDLEHWRCSPAPPDGVEAGVLRIRLADLLEHCIDLQVLYRSDLERWRQLATVCGPTVLSLARGLGLAGLAAELSICFQTILENDLPAHLTPLRRLADSVVVRPRSYRWRATILSAKITRRALVAATGSPSEPPLKAEPLTSTVDLGSVAVPPRAQTRNQLFVRMARVGYSWDDILLVARTYEVAALLFSGLLRPSGKTFIAHLVGTADVLASSKVPIALVAAALLHSAYANGDFGAGRRLWRRLERIELRRLVGAEVEGYVAGFASFEWDTALIPSIHARLASMTPLDRDLLLLRIANELEDLTDLGILYCGGARGRLDRLDQSRGKVREMALQLGRPEIGAAFEDALDEALRARLPSVLEAPPDRTTHLVPPPSLRRKLSAAGVDGARRAARKVRRAASRMSSPEPSLAG